LYYKRFQVTNKQLVPKKGPVIFAVNHQNAFMDAMVVAVTSVRRPWFLTRASIFKTAVARFWLGSLKMMPIYRIRDGIGQVKRNDKAIRRCRELLIRGQAILIFPEGDHNHKWTLRPLQKGLARIAFSTMEADPQCELKIVPVGLQYENYRIMGSELLVNFGEPVPMANYLEAYKRDPLKATEQLMADVRARILELMVHIPVDKEYNVRKKRLLERKRETDLTLRLKNDKAMLVGQPVDSSSQHKTESKHFLLKILGFPLYLYCFIHHWLSILTIRYIMKRFIRDHHWESSIRFASMIIITPLFYLLQSVLFILLTKDWVWLLAYVISLPLSAWFGAYYRQTLGVSHEQQNLF
jgi:1-acyl-sn-glycerol-3-phosphate acyltransferase